MDEKQRWDTVKNMMRDDTLSLSPKISFTMRNSLHGLLFILARYKFALKMINPKKNVTVLDLGCNDGLGSMMIQQNFQCKKIVGVDFDEEAINWAQNNIANDTMHFICDNFMGNTYFNGGGGCMRHHGCYRTYTDRKRKYFYANNL